MIKVVSFDVDGTLLDQAYNDVIWLEEVPGLYAERHGLDFGQAFDFVKGEFDRVGQLDLRWYDLNYWLRRFSLPFTSEELLLRHEDSLRIYPEVESVMSSLHDYAVIIITAMPRDFLRVKMKKLRWPFAGVFSTVSDFKSVKTPDVYSKICLEMGVAGNEVLHTGDLWDADYLAPKEAGLHALCVDRKFSLDGADVIRGLEEIRPRLEQINGRP